MMGDKRRRLDAFDFDSSNEADHRPAAGRKPVTLGIVRSAVVQRKAAPRSVPSERESLTEAGCGLDPFGIHLLASEGVSGEGGVLPHVERIKASFGDEHAPLLDGIRAHVGGRAAEAAGAIGAAAYATGDSIAFASEPDLHTAAHEAAHVVQQATGVHLYGGLGESGDVYEQHADRVADLVVRGESAREALSELGAPSPGTTRVAIQRKTAPGAWAHEILGGGTAKPSSTDGATGEVVLKKIETLVNKVFKKQEEAIDVATKRLAKAVPPADPLTMTLVKAMATAAVGAVTGTVGGIIAGSILRWASSGGSNDSVFQRFIGQAASKVTGLGDKAGGAGVTALIDHQQPKPDRDQGNAPTGFQQSIPGTFDLLDEYMKAQIDAVDEARGTASFRLADLIPASKALPASVLEPLAEEIAIINLDEMYTAQFQHTIFGWMNLNAAMSGPRHGGPTLMPGANDPAFDPAREDPSDTWRMPRNGFLDVYVVLPDTIVGLRDVGLGRLVVRSHPEVAEVLRKEKLTIGRCEVNRRVFIGREANPFFSEPAFVVTASNALEVRLSAHTGYLAAIGQGIPVDVTEAMESSALAHDSIHAHMGAVALRALVFGWPTDTAEAP